MAVSGPQLKSSRPWEWSHVKALLIHASENWCWLSAGALHSSLLEPPHVGWFDFPHSMEPGFQGQVSWESQAEPYLSYGPASEATLHHSHHSPLTRIVTGPVWVQRKTLPWLTPRKALSLWWPRWIASISGLKPSLVLVISGDQLPLSLLLASLIIPGKWFWTCLGQMGGVTG